MPDRTHLHAVAPVHQVCRLCPALVAPDLAGDLCARCLLYAAVDRAVAPWSTEQREGVLTTIHAVVTNLPPDEGAEFFALLAEIVTLDH